MIMTVKEYAESRHKTVQAVYKQLKSKTLRDQLEGHITYQFRGHKKVLFLDEAAQELLTSSSQDAPVIIEQQDQQEQIQDLKARIQIYQEKIMTLQDALIASQQRVQELQDKNIELLEQKTEKEKAAEEPPKRRRWFSFRNKTGA